MNTELDENSLKEAFQGRNDIQRAIRAAGCSKPVVELFNTISQYICEITPSFMELASKKRVLNDSATAAKAEDPVLLEIKEISMVITRRKRYTLCFTATHLYARQQDSKEPVAGTSFAWADIEYAFCLPIPEKTQKQYNYLLFPKNSNITPTKPIPGSLPVPKSIILTIPDVALEPGSIAGLEVASASAVSGDYKTLFDWALTTRFKTSGEKDLKIMQADPEQFASKIRQIDRPDEKCVHVKAFRGTKDGYLFFLPDGILWGFKKPPLFLPYTQISEISYVNVLERTFDLTVEINTTKPGEEESTEVIEFSMVDEAEFKGINSYINRQYLQNKTMVNEEEDYDPGSENESEYSGSDSEEEYYDLGSEDESRDSGSSSEEEDDYDDAGGADPDGGEEDGF